MCQTQCQMLEYNGDLKNYNFNTLEPCVYRANTLDIMNQILDKNFSEPDDLLRYMKGNKTEVALKIFSSNIKIKYPKYIEEAISK